MSSERLLSLDALRGFTIVGMIVVNSPGSWSHLYAPLAHASWHGLTPTDLVFPFFLFMVGVSIALAYRKRQDARMPKNRLIGKVVFRSAKIFALGVFLNLWPDFEFGEMRWAGVLQRIAVVFGVCAILFLNTRWRQQLWIGGAALFGYWAALTFVPVPLDSVNANALATGEVERAHGTKVTVNALASGEEALAPNYEPGINLAAWIDRRVLPGKFWERTWDPEGLASTIPACVTGIFGMLVGTLLVSIGDPYRRVSWVFLIGFASFVVGYAWSWQFPLNKNLWSSSFVLLTGGLASMGLAACLLLTDILGYKRWAKVGLVFGANAVVAYALSSMLVVVFYGGVFGMGSPSEAFMAMGVGIGLPAKLVSLIYASLYVAILYVPVWWMYSKRVFVRL